MKQTSARNPENNFFDLESAQTLEVNLDGLVWMKLGSMVAYYGDVTFRRQGLSEQGLSTVMKKFFTGEGLTLRHNPQKSWEYSKNI